MANRLRICYPPSPETVIDWLRTKPQHLKEELRDLYEEVSQREMTRTGSLSIAQEARQRKVNARLDPPSDESGRSIRMERQLRTSPAALPQVLEELKRESPDFPKMMPPAGGGESPVREPLLGWLSKSLCDTARPEEA